MSQPDVSADQRAAAAVVTHHTQLADALSRHTERLLAAAEQADLPAAQQARQDLLDWLHGELLPHARAEEGVLYPAAASHTSGTLLVDGMLDEHRTIAGLVTELEAGASPVRAAAAARALAAVFATHLAKENKLVVPLVVAADDVSLAHLLGDMHELLGDPGGTTPDGGCGGTCGCGGDAGPATAEAAVLTIDPRLDIRDIPHGQRHERVLSALESLPPGGPLVLIAPHAPRPLLAEVGARYPGLFDVEWLQSGPDVWQIRLRRAFVRA